MSFNGLRMNGSEESKSAFEEVQNYGWSNIGKKYLNLYEKLLKS